MKKPPNRKDSSQVNAYINEALSEELKIRLISDGITKKDVLNTAIHAYIDGESTTVTKEGKEIYFRCDIK